MLLLTSSQSFIGLTGRQQNAFRESEEAMHELQGVKLVLQKQSWDVK